MDMLMIKNQRGFTILELMIVLAILGILAAIAIPTYKDYTIRTKVVEGLALASSAKLGITETFESEGFLPNNNASAGVAAPSAIFGNNVSSVTVGVNTPGVITITYNGPNGTPQEIEGETLVLSPTTSAGSISWDCLSGSIDPRFRPANCR